MRVFPYPQYAHKSQDSSILLEDLTKIAALNDECGFEGILFFSTLNDPDDHWELNDYISKISQQVPIVAVMPHLEHPIVTARRITTYQHFFSRPCAINWVIGTLLSDYEKIGMTVSKDEKYEMLTEYIEIVNRLLKGETLTFRGRYYDVINHQLRRLPSFPVWQYIAGASAACERVAEKFPFINQIGTALPTGQKYGKYVKGVSFGLIARSTDEEAIHAYQEMLPKSRAGDLYFEFAKKNTDSEWKEQLYRNLGKDGENGYFPGALKSFSDTAFIVGSYERMAKYLKDLLGQGIEHFIINTIRMDEVLHYKKVFDIVK